jgi:hypothetical protein
MSKLWKAIDKYVAKRIIHMTLLSQSVLLSKLLLKGATKSRSQFRKFLIGWYGSQIPENWQRTIRATVPQLSVHFTNRFCVLDITICIMKKSLNNNSTNVNNTNNFLSHHIAEHKNTMKYAYENRYCSVQIYIRRHGLAVIKCFSSSLYL